MQLIFNQRRKKIERRKERTRPMAAGFATPMAGEFAGFFFSFSHDSDDF
jgi:hypothetical protein